MKIDPKDIHVGNLTFMLDCTKKFNGGKIDEFSNLRMTNHELVRVVKDGEKHMVYHIEHYPDLPKCWVDGFEYKFCSRIIARYVLEDREDVTTQTRSTSRSTR